MRCQIAIPFFAVLCLACDAGASAADAPSNDEATIRKNVQAYVQAYQRQDAKALAALWAPKATYVNPETGKRAAGREAIEAEFRAQFKKSAAGKLRVNVQSIRLVTPDVAIEDGSATVTSAEGERSESSYTAVHVKQGKEWLLDSVRETMLPPPGKAHEHLRPLEWLIGQWDDADENAAVHSVYKWTANQAFLTHTFTAYVQDRLELQGTQVIGWDAAAKRIRSWAFDSDGGFAEATWEQDGDRWIIRSKSTLPDGQHGSAINTLRKIDDGHYTWKSSARQVGDELLPNVDEIEIVRQDNPADEPDQSEDEE